MIDAGYSNTKLPIGAAVALGIELQLQGQRVRSFNEEYAIPMRSTEGMMRIINIAFRDGSARFTAEMNDSKRWGGDARARQQRPACQGAYGLCRHRITGVENS